MLRVPRLGRVALAAVAATAFTLSGCTSIRDYVHNGFKVGPNYQRPCAPVAKDWLDSTDPRVRKDRDEQSHWWTVFNDATLNHLIQCAYQQNLTVREAGFRVLQARAQLGIATGNLFPQQQTATGSYRRQKISGAGFGLGGGGAANPFGGGRTFDLWTFGFNLGWEVDVWGRFRRAIEAAEDTLDASVEDYDAILVTLLGDVATNYIQIRTDQERITLLRANVELQRGVLTFIERRFKAGFRVTELDLDQAQSTLSQTEAAIPQLEIDMRQAANRLSILLGMPPIKVQDLVGAGPIPTAPADVVVGIPADLLRRRPDVRRAERQAAGQSQQIGIAESDLYPMFTINGTLNWQAQRLNQLFTPSAFNGSIGPSFQWNLLNYGRILNNVRLQEARFQELVVAYQNAVLQANADAENGLVTFLQSQDRAKFLDQSVYAARRAVNVVIAQYEKGATDFNRYALIEQNLVQQQDLLAQARGQIGQGLVQVYRALGGGWQIRCQPQEGAQDGAANQPTPPGQAPPPSPVPERIPAPTPLLELPSESSAKAP